MKLAMIIDLQRCFGCNSCTVACKQANATAPDTYYARVLYSEAGTYPHSKPVWLPVLCNHCDNAPCVTVCPTKASQKLDDGTVQIDAAKCIGCQLCMKACPYGARFFNKEADPTYWGDKGQAANEKARAGEHRVNTVDKCTFCAPRRAANMAPACVETCPAQARIFGDLDDPQSAIAKLFKAKNPKPHLPEKGTKPRVFYIDPA
jgi:Fe-S-cluster-containing dehydrogenase component